ncbi:MAG: hypothetical protein U9O20_02540 [Patescibacteria group bacterium]|nr:hypothetical protein [Patescibacteria group bacterium]
MGIDTFPEPETSVEALSSWQERIFSDAVELFKDELQRQKAEGEQLGAKVGEFETLAKGLVSEKKDEWSEILSGSNFEEEASEDVEKRLARSLVIITKEKLEE